MKQIVIFALSAVLMLATSCSRPHYDRFLTGQDSIILTNPKLVLQNLEEVNPHDYKGRDEAYYNLLLTMARDKNFYRFDFSQSEVVLPLPRPLQPGEVDSVSRTGQIQD